LAVLWSQKTFRIRAGVQRLVDKKTDRDFSRWGIKEMKRGIGGVVGSKNAWIAPWLLNSKHRKLRNAAISKKGRHDFTLGGVHIVLQDF
jgi:hypothetical protein